ncbi:signal peptidase I [Patescibacteria group bacterium]|nr:signal peptidase I [Patescibacteria group bacterium]MCL5797806.1 signal peptidase I [Patescibacteria group bacterium]
MKYLKKIVKVILSIFTFIAIPVILFVLITSHFSVFGGIRSFDVLTGSMEPTIHVGSMIFTRPVSTYKVGDIITFKRGDISVTHRIHALKNGQYQTKGDANISPDPQLVSSFQIIGKDIYIFPNVGKLTNFIKSFPGFISLIVVPILLFVGFELNTIKEEYKKVIRKDILEEMNAYRKV